jgi:NAD(P)H-flavin reductase
VDDWYQVAHCNYGERTFADLCYQDKFAQWEADFGFRVVPCLSQPTEKDSSDSTTVKKGYVQDVLQSDGLHGHDPGTCFALVCGISEMMNKVTDYLKGEGVDSSKIMLNLEA